MQTSKNIKLMCFLTISFGFLLIASVCMMAKNKSLRINNYNKELIVKDTLKMDAAKEKASEKELMRIDFPNNGNALRIELSSTVSY